MRYILVKSWGGALIIKVDENQHIVKRMTFISLEQSDYIESLDTKTAQNLIKTIYELPDHVINEIIKKENNER